jgi:hypothetical protein
VAIAAQTALPLHLVPPQASPLLSHPFSRRRHPSRPPGGGPPPPPPPPPPHPPPPPPRGAPPPPQKPAHPTKSPTVPVSVVNSHFKDGTPVPDEPFASNAGKPLLDLILLHCHSFLAHDLLLSASVSAVVWLRSTLAISLGMTIPRCGSLLPPWNLLTSHLSSMSLALGVMAPWFRCVCWLHGAVNNSLTTMAMLLASSPLAP